MDKWSIPFDKLAQKVNLDIATVIRKSSFQIFNEVVVRTPVDTGRLSGNWKYGNGNVNTLTTENTNKNASLQDAHEALNMIMGQINYFTNSLPYARRIEYEGWSQIKAPQGMVRISVERFSDYVRRNI